MLALSLGCGLCLLVSSSLTPAPVEQLPDWDDLPFDARWEQAARAWATESPDWLVLRSEGRRVARFDGDLLVVYADLEASSVDRDLTMQTNTQVEVDRPVALLEMPTPNYPLEARDRGVEGYVQLRCRVSTGGQVDLIVVPTGEDVDYLTDAAIEAVRNARFEPARRQGNDVSMWKLIPFEFVLEDATRLAR